MKKNYQLIIILIIILITVLAGYYAYNQYNTSKTKQYLKISAELKNNATNYFDQAEKYQKSGDYSKAIQAYQMSSDNISKALFNDKQALNTANGPYREYLDVDIPLLEKTAKLLEYKIYQAQYQNNSLNQGQEKVNPSLLAPYIENLTMEVSNLKQSLEQIKNSNPYDFNFAN